MDEDAFTVARPPGGIHFIGEGIGILLGKLALSGGPLRFDKGDEVGLVRMWESFLREREYDSAIGVLGMERDRHNAKVVIGAKNSMMESAE